MQVNSSKLFIEINRLEFKFVVVQSLENDNFELIYKKISYYKVSLIIKFLILI